MRAERKARFKVANIYLITPSWLIKKKRSYWRGIKNLENLGFKIQNKKFLIKIPSLRQKVAQIHAALKNERTEIILAQRGGYGCMKLLPYLDFELIKKKPKIFAGFSDLSALLNVIYEKTGLITWHAPMIINFSPVSNFTIRSFLNACRGFPQKNLFSGAPLKVYRSGIARGILKGGNLITLTALLGTSWEIKTAGTILFLEEVDQKLYEVDRLLTQWILAQKFAKVKGLILGNFRGLKSQEVFEILRKQIKINFPVVYCPYIGHVQNKITLPIGAKVTLNTFENSLNIL